MKKLFYLVILGAGIIGCTSDSIESETIESYDAGMKIQGTDALIIPEIICAGEEAEFGLEAETGTNLQVQQWVEGEWVQVYQTNSSTESPETFVLEFDEAGEYDLRYKNGPGGFSDAITITVDNCGCTNELTADLTCGEVSTLLVTFTAEEAGPVVIQGGLTNDTEILSKESNVLTADEDHPGVVNSNANVTRWEGEVDACEEVTIYIEFEGGNGIGDWTAKRGEELLGETEDQECDTEE